MLSTTAVDVCGFGVYYVYMDHLKLDFSGFSKQFSRQEIRSAMKERYLPKWTTFPILLIIFLLPLGLIMNVATGMVLYSVLWTLLLQSASNTIRLTVVLACFTVPPIIVFYAIRKFLRASVIKSLRMQAFVAANKLDYPQGAAVGESGLLFSRGHSRVFTGGFRFPDTGHLEIANYSYTEGDGRNSRTYARGIIRCDVSRNLPNVLLDATSNNFMGRFSNLGSFSGGQRIEVEGDFNKYFTVYCPADYATDTLYWLTPELMQLLKERMANYDIEVVDNHVYAYSSHTFTFNEPAIRELLQLGEWLRAEFEQNTRRYADDRVANSSVTNVVATPGKRLKQRVSWVSIAGVILYIVLRLLLDTHSR